MVALTCRGGWWRRRRLRPPRLAIVRRQSREANSGRVSGKCPEPSPRNRRPKPGQPSLPARDQKSMPASHRLAALALAIASLAPVTADAMDEWVRAIGSGPTLLELCGTDNAPITPAACKDAGFDTLATQIEKALQATLARTPVNIRPLLKRDQVWFGEIAVSAAESVPQSDDDEAQEAFVASLRERITTLQGIAAGFGRVGVAGRWMNAFGSVVVTPADSGAYRIAIETRSVYGTSSDRRRECQASALLRPDPSGWLTGRIFREDSKPAQTADGAKS